MVTLPTKVVGNPCKLLRFDYAFTNFSEAEFMQ